MARPKCFFDITIGGNAAGRIVFEVSVLSFDYRPYDSCAHTARFFSSTSFFIVLFRICATPLLAVDTFFCYLQLRADVVPKTAGLYKSLFSLVFYKYNEHSFNSASDTSSHIWFKQKFC